MVYGFGAYTLDTDRYELRRAGKVCPLEPHAVDILTYFLQHPDRVVTKRELLEQLWPGRFVGEGILAQRIMTIRKAIGDSGQTQRCIATVHGRGYRFAAEVSVYPRAADVQAFSAPPSPPELAATAQVVTSHHTLSNGSAPAAARPALFSRPPHFVGRDSELARLEVWWSAARQGRRHVAFIGGEPGIGKTALVDAFVAQLAAAHDVSVGCGQCVDDYGMGEAYRPLLEALGRLCRDAEGDRFVACLREQAPSWLAHLPSVLDPDDRAAAARTAGDVTSAQMLRELTDALEALTAERPLVLVLEDLHWSDRATLAWLAYMARKRDSARLLILGTYRPHEGLGRAHPLRALLVDLRPQAQCAELGLDGLSASAVAAYLSNRCGGALPSDAPQLIHRRTGGHPLFLVSMVDELLHDRCVGRSLHNGAAREQLVALSDIVPANVREYIEQHLERLSREDQALLEIASVAGTRFTVAAVAGRAASATDRIDARYAALAREGRFIQSNGVETWPDATTTPCYQFKHGLYQEVAYARVSAGRRMQLHQQIGLRKERGYGVETPQIAAELAVHFVRGGDNRRAVQYLHEAADKALQRSAYQEAMAHLTQGLALLASLPDAAERTQHELRFLTALGLAFVATKGQAHVDVQRSLARARALCHQVRDPHQLFRVLGGLFSFHVVRSELSAASDVAAEFAALADREPDSALRLGAHWAFGQSLFFEGEFVKAREQLEQGITLYDRRAHHDPGLCAGFPHNIGVVCRCFAAHALWHLGYPDQALHHIQQALTLAEELAHVYSRVVALAYAAMLYQFRGDAHLTREAAETATVLCQEHGFPYYLAWVTILKGWALTAQEQGKEGQAEMRRGLDAIGATGARVRQPYYLSLLAAACGRTDETDVAQTMVAEALEAAQHRGEHWQEAELYRLKGELLIGTKARRGGRSPSGGSQTIAMQGERCFQHALVIARRQHARSLELRAATSLAKLWQRQGKRSQAHELLAPVHCSFTEGLDTADIREARALLSELTS